MMPVPDTIRWSRVHGAMYFAGLLGLVGLIDWLCCSQEDISRGAWPQDVLNVLGRIYPLWLCEQCLCMILASM